MHRPLVLGCSGMQCSVVLKVYLEVYCCVVSCIQQYSVVLLVAFSSALQWCLYLAGCRGGMHYLPNLGFNYSNIQESHLQLCTEYTSLLYKSSKDVFCTKVLFSL